MRYLVLLLVMLVIGCNNPLPPNLGEATQYYPSEMFDDSGAVWKYYEHSILKDGERKTDIKYKKIILNGTNLTITDYRADFLIEHEEKLEVVGDVWNVNAARTYDYFNNKDSLSTANNYIITDDKVYMDWTSEIALLNRSLHTERWDNTISQKQTEIVDTIIENKDVKIFNISREIVFVMDGDTTINQIDLQREFTQGLGMTASFLATERFKIEWELDEIITLEEFEKRSNHGMHRVAYINPEDAIDDQSDFTTCFHISKVNDYYNDDRAKHLESKAGLWELVENNLDATLLKNQEGYFTFRFVVNCQGEAGRFVTEEADLEFNRVEFSTALRSQLLSMLLDVPKWKNLTINGEARDAYVYVTFKIKDDEIIEILP